jgi:putative ABC transport system ATP-binding protein
MISSNEKTENQKYIELKKIVKQYNGSGKLFSALKGIDLNFISGGFTAIIGKSGSGKSTILNILAGIDRPSSGEIYVDNIALHNLTESETAKWRGKNIGIVFQFFQLIPTLTVLENVMLPMDFIGKYPVKERRVRAKDLLHTVDILPQIDKLPSSLSGGEQQRVAIARALANDPKIILADEPTGNLDTKTSEEIFELFQRLVQNNKTVVMVTHNQDFAKRVDRTIELKDGLIINDIFN